jgi:nicotinamide-nucleotide amidase
MKAVILTIGDEILIGQVVNTNAQFISKKLFSAGIAVDRVISLGDDEREIIKEFRLAYKKYDVIVVTGGLGPTHDDITKICITKFFKSKLIRDKNVLKHIRQIYSRRKIALNDSQIMQAMVPDAAIALHNKLGTAPGILVDKGGKIFCALPGIPYEMEYITEHGLIPYIKKKYKGSKRSGVLLQKTLHTIGIAESRLAQRLGDIGKIARSGKDYSVKLAFLPSFFEVRLRITIEAASEKKATSLLKESVKIIKDKAASYIYSYDQSPLQKVVGDILRKRKLWLSVAESCTGGLIASKITDIAGSSDYFLEGLVTYADKAKMNLLGVKRATLKKYGAVSGQTAIEMAGGIRKRSGSDVSISVTGIAGPAGATPGKPVGLVWIGYSNKKKTFAKKFIFTRERFRNKEIMSKMALEVLRRELLGINN